MFKFLTYVLCIRITRALIPSVTNMHKHDNCSKVEQNSLIPIHKRL